MSTDIRVVDFFPGRDPSVKVRCSAIKREWNVQNWMGLLKYDGMVIIVALVKWDVE